MKRFLTAFLCAALIAVVAAGCRVQDPLDAQSSSSATEVTSSVETESVKASDYENSLDGLCNYFDALGYINKDKDTKTEMDASLIGADKGYKYKSGNVSVELYAYSDTLNDTAKKIISSVKKDGSFEILDLPSVKAYLSDNEKYLLIYSDASINDEKPDENSSAYKKRAEVIDAFKSFYA